MICPAMIYPAIRSLAITFHDPLFEISTHFFQNIRGADPFGNIELVIRRRSSKSLDRCISEGPIGRMYASRIGNFQQLNIVFSLPSQQFFVGTEMFTGSDQGFGIG